MKYQVYIHEENDDVGVAVTDLEEGEKVKAKVIKSTQPVVKEVKVNEDVPLTHKVSLVDMDKGHKVIEYDEVIGETTKNIEAGDHVHTHNIRSIKV